MHHNIIYLFIKYSWSNQAHSSVNFKKRSNFCIICSISQHPVLKKFPGVEVKCKWCGEILRSYVKHLQTCSIIGLETKQPLLQIVTINLFDWCDITNKQHYIDLAIKVYLLFN